MKSLHFRPWAQLLAFILFLAAGVLASVLWYQNKALTKQLQQQTQHSKLQQQFLEDLKEENTQLQQELAAIKILLRSKNAELRQCAAYDSSFTAAVEAAKQAAQVLQGYATVDRELLQKYSKVYFLNEHYQPKKLISIPQRFSYGGKEIQVLQDMYPFLEAMLVAMEKEGLAPRVVSGYRSFETQKNLKARHVMTFGTTEANRFVADQGYSEHQLGTTVDIVDAKTGGLDGFEKTPEYAWLQKHAHEYGFILSYPEGNGYYAFEPWHWRFVGIALARELKKRGETFYEAPQRFIFTYLPQLFDQTLLPKQQ